jgi:hypothetical protein
MIKSSRPSTVSLQGCSCSRLSRVDMSSNYQTTRIRSTEACLGQEIRHDQLKPLPERLERTVKLTEPLFEKTSANCRLALHRTKQPSRDGDAPQLTKHPVLLFKGEERPPFGEE